MINISVVLYKTSTIHIMALLSSIECCSFLQNIYIIDNSPTNKLKSFFDSSKLNFIYIHNPENTGYGASHNIAIKESLNSLTEYHLVMNPDIRFTSDIIEPLLNFMSSHLQVGLVMPKILNSDGSIQQVMKLLPSPSDLFLRRFTPKFFLLKRKRIYELAGIDLTKPAFIPNLSGCFMLLRSSALQDIGLFDEHFFMYCEDIDLTRRMAENYYTIYYPDVVVYHEHGKESYQSLRMLMIHVLSAIRYFNKWGWVFDPQKKILNDKVLIKF